MKKFFKIGATFLSLAFLFTGCNDKPDHTIVGQFHSNPISGAEADGATVEMDKDLREITLIYSEPRDLSAVSVKLTLEKDVRMVSPETNPFTADLSNDAVRKVTVWSYDREITYKLRASVAIDVAEPVTNFTASADGHEAEVSIDHENRKISLVFDYNVDLTNIAVDFNLGENVEVVAPEGKTWDISSPVTFKLKKYTMESNYTVTASINIDIAEPFSEFTAVADGKYNAAVKVDHAKRTVDLAFDGYGIELNGVAVGFTLAEGVTVVSPEGNSWDLDENVPTEFKLRKQGLDVIYTVNTEVSIDVSQPIVSLTATAGSENAAVVLDNTGRTISLIFETATDLSAVAVDYTLAENVTVKSPLDKVWNLSSATKENPFEFNIHKLGMDITYKVYTTKFFVPEFRDENGDAASIPADWERITANVSPDVAFYKVPQWNGGGSIVAYAIAVQASKIDFSTVGDGYDAQKSLPILAERVPDANFVINGGDQRNLLVINGEVVNNIEGGDGNFSILADNQGKMYMFSATNRINEFDDPCDPSGARDGKGTQPRFVNDIYWWDLKIHYPGIINTGAIGAGLLNWGARTINDGQLFPNGILNGADTVNKVAQTAYGANGDCSVFYFFVCEKSSRSEGITQRGALEIIRNMGANDGALGTIGNKNSIGLYFNGESLINPTDGANSPIGYAFSIKSK